jgi:hypothetical protein
MAHTFLIVLPTWIINAKLRKIRFVVDAMDTA